MAMKGKVLAKADALRREGQPAEALAVLQKALAKAPRDRKLLLLAGDTAEMVRDWDAARTHYEALSALGSTSFDIRLRLATVYWRLDRLYDAVPLLEALAEEAPEQAEIWRLLGEVRMMHQDWDGAADAWGRALALAPGDPRTALRHVAALQNAPRFEGQALDAARATEPLLEGDAPRQRELADWYFYQHRYEDADRLYGAALSCANERHLDVPFFRDFLTLCRRTGQNSRTGEILERARRFLASQGAVFKRAVTDFQPLDDYQQVPKAVAEARLICAMGDPDWPARLEAAYAPISGTVFHYTDKTYRPGMPGRLDRLRSIIAGRPVALLFPGPSIEDLRPHMPALAEAGVCFACTNKFDRLEAEFLEPVGAAAEIVLLLARQEWHVRFEALKGFLERPQANAFLTAGPLLNLGTALLGADFAARYDERIVTFSGRSSAPPTPSDPLSIHYVNTLGAMVPLLALAGAQSIAIFGADGGQAPEGDIYFHGETALRGEDEAAFSADALAREKARYGDLLGAEAVHCNEHLPFVLAAMGLLHGFVPPPMAIGTPGSAYRFAERMSAEAAARILLEGGEVQENRPAA